MRPARRATLLALLVVPMSGCSLLSRVSDADDAVGYRWVCHADEEDAWSGEWRRLTGAAIALQHQGHGDPVSLWEQPVGAECER